VVEEELILLPLESVAVGALVPVVVAPELGILETFGKKYFSAHARRHFP